MSTTANDPPIEAETGVEEALSEPTDSGVRDHAGVSRDDLFDVLSNHRRRYALHSLKQCDSATSIGELSEEIAAWENGVSRGDLTSTQRKRVYTSLQQFHLPKMDATGLVEFDSARGVVILTETTTNLDVYLDVVAEDDVPWSRYYLGLSALSLAVVAGVWFAPFTLLPATAWTTFVAVVFFVSSLVHTYYDRKMRLGAAGTPPDLQKR